MIFEWFFDVGLMFIDGILSLLDVLPNMPSQGVTVIDEFFDFLFNSVRLFTLLIDLDLFLILLPIVVSIIQLEYAYYITMFVLKKIPFISIK